MMPRFLLALASGLLLIPTAGLRAQEQSFDSGGVKIHYAVEGKGEPVLLIHGFAVNTPIQWGLPGIVKELAKEYRVITYDNRGHGRSDKPRDVQKYGKEMIADAVRLLDHLKIERAHVVGYSMGAFITLKLLTTHPERILTATLGGAGRPDPDGQRFMEELADSLEQGQGFGPLVIRLTPPGQPKPTPEQIKAVNGMLTAINDTRALSAVIRGFKDFAIPEEKVKANKVPTLALIGALDPLKEGVDALNGRMPNLKIVVIDGADHVNAFARPEFVKRLKEFLAGHKQSEKGKKAQTVPPDGAPR